MFDDFLNSYIFFCSEWVLGLGMLFCYCAAAELGYQVGKRNHSADLEKLKPHVSSIQNSVLGLLALLLGFTFSMSIARFETRKQLIIQEADAIGTAYLRTKIIKEPYQTQFSEQLKEYVNNRLEYLTIGLNIEKLKTALNRTEELHQKIWNTLVEASKNEDKLIYISLLMTSINEMIDLHAQRLQAAMNRVPDAILYLIFILAVLCLAITGYSMGLDHHRNLIITTILSFMIMAVIIVIIDLDRPGRGMIKENMSSMFILKEELNKKSLNPAR